MSESFVDLSYRGLALGKRIKLTQVRPATGYLELPMPMPVGTMIGIATDDGVLLEAMVTEVHEQVTGSDRTPGMFVKPKLDADGAQTWWKSRADLPAEKKIEKPAPTADAGGVVTVVSRRPDAGVPELVDDGRNTAVMGVMDSVVESKPRDSRAVEASLEGDTDPSMPPVPRDTNPNLPALPPIVDDGKRTMMMDAVDLAALGLDPASSSGQMAAVKPEDYADDNGGVAADNGAGDNGAAGDRPEGKAKKKRKRR